MLFVLCLFLLDDEQKHIPIQEKAHSVDSFLSISVKIWFASNTFLRLRHCFFNGGAPPLWKTFNRVKVRETRRELRSWWSQEGVFLLLYFLFLFASSSFTFTLSNLLPPIPPHLISSPPLPPPPLHLLLFIIASPPSIACTTFYEPVLPPMWTSFRKAGSPGSDLRPLAPTFDLSCRRDTGTMISALQTQSNTPPPTPPPPTPPHLHLLLLSVLHSGKLETLMDRRIRKNPFYRAGTKPSHDPLPMYHLTVSISSAETNKPVHWCCAAFFVSEGLLWAERPPVGNWK